VKALLDVIQLQSPTGAMGESPVKISVWQYWVGVRPLQSIAGPMPWNILGPWKFKSHKIVDKLFSVHQW